MEIYRTAQPIVQELIFHVSGLPQILNIIRKNMKFLRDKGVILCLHNIVKINNTGDKYGQRTNCHYPGLFRTRFS